MNVSKQNLSESQVQLSPDSLTEAKNQLGQFIVERLDECAMLWNTISSKQTIITELITDQIKVSSKLCQYNDLWSTATRDSRVSDIHTFHHFTQLDEQVQQLSQKLDQFEQKLFPTASTVRSLIRDWRKYFASLRETLSKISGAETPVELGSVELPSLEWYYTSLDPEVESLLQEWEKLQLDTKMSHCLSQLEAHLMTEGMEETHQVITDL